MSNTTHSHCCVRGFIHEGQPVGNTIKVLDDLEVYISLVNKDRSRSKTALLFSPDIYSLNLLNSKLLADKICNNAKIDVYVIDLFRGKGAPGEIITAPEGEKPHFDFNAWLSTIDMEKYIADGVKFAKYLREELKYEVLGTVGFCFGAQTVVNLCAKDSPVKIDFGSFAHPSLTKIADYENWGDVPSLFIVCEVDSQFPINKQVEVIMKNKKKTSDYHRFVYFSKVHHGFTIRAKCAGDEANSSAIKAHEELINFYKSFV